jgi:hypothetical protein
MTIRKNIRYLLGGLLALWFGAAATAGRVDHVNVSKQKQRYDVLVSAWIDLPQPSLRNLLTDYDTVIKANRSIKSVQQLASPSANVTRLAAEVEVCVWFFCRRLKQVQDMQLVSAGLLEARMLPELSDYKFGEASWRMIAEADGSRLLFAVSIEPDFWVPPLIGPAVIKRKLRQEAIETVHGIEALAASQNHE